MRFAVTLASADGSRNRVAETVDELFDRQQASQSTRRLVPGFSWQELDRVRVKGKEQAVATFSPVAATGHVLLPQAEELQTWTSFMHTYRHQDWAQGEWLMRKLQRSNEKKFLYELYSERVASMKSSPFDPGWDGATNFETK
jgi:adenylate cyclase